MKLRKPKVRFGGAGLELQHAGVAAGRRLHVAGIALRIAEMQMRLGEIGLEADRAPQMRDRLLVAAERAQRERDVVAALRIFRLERDRLADQVDGGFVASGLLRQHAEIMQARRVLRIDRERLAIMQVGIGELSGLMMPRAGREQLRDRRPLPKTACPSGSRWRPRDRPLLSAKRTVRRNRYTATASLARSARLRSFGSSSRLRRRIDFGVTSTSSSSPI